MTRPQLAGMVPLEYIARQYIITRPKICWAPWKVPARLRLCSRRVSTPEKRSMSCLARN